MTLAEPLWSVPVLIWFFITRSDTLVSPCPMMELSISAEEVTSAPSLSTTIPRPLSAVLEEMVLSLTVRVPL